jgi:hypothetical protein
MTKIAIALASFVADAASMFFVGNHTSTFAASQGATLAPEVKPPSFTMQGFSTSGIGYKLDGIICTDCTFSDVTFVYGGGAYLLRNVQMSKPIRLRLEGAALNTANLLNSFGLLGCHANEPKPPAPKLPQIMEATYVATPKENRDFISPVGNQP